MESFLLAIVIRLVERDAGISGELAKPWRTLDAERLRALTP
jgi:hypothetical protein